MIRWPLEEKAGWKGGTVYGRDSLRDKGASYPDFFGPKADRFYPVAKPKPQPGPGLLLPDPRACHPPTPSHQHPLPAPPSPAGLPWPSLTLPASASTALSLPQSCVAVCHLPAH